MNLTERISAPRIGQPSERAPRADDTIAVVITTYNHAQYLAAAIDSVTGQTRPADEVIVIDDGSTDDPQAVVVRYPGIRLIRQDNAGLASARNTGLNAATAKAIVFLDADDRLLPTALEVGLACLRDNPAVGFVCGGHRRIDQHGTVVGAPTAMPAQLDYADLLLINRVEMHAAVTYRRDRLHDIGGFDPALRMCEDHDVLLRMSHRFSCATHRGIVAEYRQHAGNMSKDARSMLHWALLVQDRQRPCVQGDARLMAAWRAGRQCWKDFYGPLISRSARQRIKRRLRRSLPRFAMRWVDALRGAWPPAVGHASFGSFGRTQPISDAFGYDRGTPVDRHYIEGFLDRHRAAIHGRVLEVGDAAYSRRYGGSRIVHQDVLHIVTQPQATIVGDLSSPGVLPAAAFDCIVLTQTLHLLFDMKAAVEELFNALKPGAVLLLTVPGISRVDRDDWGSTWYWSLTPASALRLFAERFGSTHVQVESHGNVHTATAFLQGLAFEEMDRSKVDVVDPCFPVIVAVRAVKAGGR